METIHVENWKGHLGKGLAPRELEATLWCAEELTAKEAARKMSCSPYTVSALLDNARFKLGMQRTCRGLLLEAMKRGIIAPLVLVLFICSGHSTLMPPARRPESPRNQLITRIQRIEEAQLTT